MRRLWGTAVLLALFTAATWFAWLGWDHQYYEVGGVAQGPYRPWQVLGCGATVVAATVLAYVRVRGVLALFVLAAAGIVGFAVPWARDAGASDDTGLWMVGLFMLVIGGGVGLLMVLTVTYGVLVSRGPGAPGRPAGAARRP